MRRFRSKALQLSRLGRFSSRSNFKNVMASAPAKRLFPTARPTLRPGTIVLDHITKRFRKRTLSKRGYSTIKTSFLTRLFQRRFPRENWLYALRDVSLHIEPGKAVGVIGRNGSGKSTLLKLIAGIYRPESGEVAFEGRISALIELGAGFHPDFTGRENVYLGGVMFGLSRKEIDDRFDSIVRYAKLEEFIDDPVRTYSSGMYMRLGFSLAVHTDPDILLIDEVLAVGDAAFIHRCHDTISEFKRQGKTLLFVTHDLDSVARWCDEALWLDGGVVRERGEPRRVIDCYLQEVEDSERKELLDANASQEQTTSVESAEGQNRWGSREVEITSVRMFSATGEAQWLFQSEEPLTIEIEYRINQAVEDLVFGVGILRADGLCVYGTNTDIDDISVPQAKNAESIGQTGICRYHIKRLGLVEDTYYLDVAVHRKDGYPFDYHHLLHRFSVRVQHRHQGVCSLQANWEIKPLYPVNETKLADPSTVVAAGRRGGS